MEQIIAQAITQLLDAVSGILGAAGAIWLGYHLLRFALESRVQGQQARRVSHLTRLGGFNRPG